MNRGPLIFLGAFAILALSWTALVLANQVGFGLVTPHYDPIESASFPAQMPGIAKRGSLVYRDLGCAACHTQQVRREDAGGDIERGWGARASVVRDYIYEPVVQIGESRFGPDLRNVGARQTDESRLYHYLYAPNQVVDGSSMPAYRFLYETRKVVGERSDEALNLPVNPGYEIVPTERARSLVAYLMYLNDTYSYPEVNFVPSEEDHSAETAEEGGH